MVKQDSFDAVVIGSGFGGAVASCRLSQAGFCVLLLERGRRYEKDDFPAQPARDRLVPDLRRLTWQNEQGLWDFQDLDEVVSVQAAGYGGGSLIYANVHLRPPASVFNHRWPKRFRRRKALDEFFDLAAYMLDVSPITARPEGVFTKTSTLDGAMTALGRDKAFFHPPLAVNYVPKTNDFGEQQNPCDGCGRCMGGCPKRAKNTLDLNYLAVAEKRGTSVRTQCEVTGIVQLQDGTQPRWRVDYTDHLSARSLSVETSAVFLCAGTIHSTRLLSEVELRQPRDERDKRVGLGYFPNADALSIAYDTTKAHHPSCGPTITTTTVHWDQQGDGFFLIQDGGYAPEMARLAGFLRASLWAGRNRLSLASKNRCVAKAPPDDPLRGVALVSPLDGLLDARAEGLLEQVLSQQVVGAWPQFRAELQHPILLPGIVAATIDRGSRAKQAGLPLLLRWLLRLLQLGAPLRALVRLMAKGSLGSSETIADHALLAILNAADGGRKGWAREVLGYGDEHAERRVVLLGMGRDETPGTLHYDAKRRRLSADLDLYHLIPDYTDQERLMSDVAGKLGGELRVNPAFSFLGKPFTVHSQGGCRMSDQPTRGVTQPDGQVHGSPGLYVMDGSVLCGSTGVNPSATILAVAEHNVLEFIRARRQNSSWPSGDSSEGAREYAAHRRAAAKWRRQADAKEWRLEPPPKPKRYVDFTSEPLGLEFDEVMQGYCNGLGVQAAPSFELLEPPLADDALYRRNEISARPKHPVRVDLTASVANLSRFFEDYQHRLELRGNIAVDVPGLAYQGECRGYLDLFVPRYKSRGLDQNDQREAQQQITGRCYTTVVGTSEPSDERFMRYYLSFDGDRARLAGYKRIRQDPGLDAWRDTSALFTQIGRPRRGANGSLPELGKGQLDVIAAGVIHVDLTGFLYDQMPSFRVLGTTDEARRTWAITKFNTFFFGALQRVYAPEAQTALSALFGVKANDVHFGAGS